MKKNLIIIPGNPPAHFYYNQWISELKISFSEVNFQYLAYQKLDHNQAPSKQMEHTLKKLERKLRELYTESKVILLGHSYGAYFAYELAKRCPDIVEKVLMIFPFFGRPKLTSKMVLLSARYLKRYTQAIVQLQNLHGKSPWQYPPFKNIESEELITALDHAQIESYLFKDQSQFRFQETQAKVHLIYNPKDSWSPPKTTKKLRKHFHGIATSAEHDFILKSSQRKIISEILAPLI